MVRIPGPRAVPGARRRHCRQPAGRRRESRKVHVVIPPCPGLPGSPPGVSVLGSPQWREEV